MKVLIVDDEDYVVKYLNRLLDWQQLGFDEVVEATSGVAARRELLAQQPELLITDIRMPEVSGLDLLKEIEQKHLDTAVIILSGYSDFEYAQQAVHYGVTEYLVKPVVAVDLRNAVGRAIEAKTAPMTAAALSSSIKQHFDEFLISSLTLTDYRMADYEQFRNSLKKAHWAGQWQQDQVDADSLTLKGQVFTLAPAASSNVPRPQFRRSFFGRFSAAAPDQTLLETMAPCALSAQLANALAHLDEQADAGLLQLAVDCYAVLLKHQLAGKLNLSLSAYLESFLQAPQGFVERFNRITAADQAESTQQATVADIKAYIDHRYNQQVSLQILADQFHLHPVYISRLFKAQTNDTVNGYITHVRMKKARDLLLHTDLHINEISDLIGYRKNQYFIQLFDRTYGTTPNKYRQLVRQESVDES